MKVSLPKLSRRRFVWLSLLAAPVAVWAEAKWLEPNWVKVRKFKLTGGQPALRLVQITDIHYKGDRAYLEQVVRKINALSPDAVCFTGDLIEDRAFVPAALQILEGVKSPIYAVPGNHDYWSKAVFSDFTKSFAKSGGAFLRDSQAMTADGKIMFSGVTCLKGAPASLPPRPGVKNILLIHYPLMAERVTEKYDLMLAGHSHGGQVRIPFYGAILLPFWVGKYEIGRFDLPAGPLYVNPGIGWLGAPYRFNCRPEITVFDI